MNAASPSFKGSFESGGNWQHTFFQGGFSIIINNGLQAPNYILDSEDNTETANVEPFAPLPNWESYAEELTVPDGGENLTNLTVTAGVIRAYGDFLVAGNLVERGDYRIGTETTVTQGVIRALPGIIRSSDIAAPGAIPQNWNPFDTASNTADEFVITADGVVQDFAEQQNCLSYSSQI